MKGRRRARRRPAISAGVMKLGIASLAIACGLCGGDVGAQIPEDRAPADLSATLVVDTVGLDEAAIQEELRLRLPDRTIQLPSETVGVPARYARLVLRDDGVLEVTLVTRDGRAFDREFAAEADQVSRVAASALSNLIFSIEAGELEPDRTGVAIPQGESASRAEPLDPLDPRAEVPAPAPTSTPVSTQSRTRTGEVPEPRSEDDHAPSRSGSGWGLGPLIFAGPVLGLAPRTGSDVFAAAGGSVGLDVWAPVGALASLDVRVAGRGRRGIAVTRFRVALGGGYAFRWQRIVLPVVGSISVEPWILRRDGARVAAERDGAGVPTRPLLGAAVRVSPGYAFSPRSGLEIRAGARVGLGASFIVDGGIGTPNVREVGPDGDATPLYRVGGLELELGVEVAVVFGLRARR